MVIIVGFNKFITLIVAVMIGLAFSFALFMHSYYIPDKALFTGNTLLDYGIILISTLVLIFAVVLLREIDYKNAFIISIILIVGTQLSFVVLYPLEPFSDMGAIYQISTLGIRSDSFELAFEKGGYLANFPNNTYYTLFLSALYSFLPKTILVAKCINIFSSIIIVACAGLIFRELFGKKYSGGLIILMSIFPPSILYANHIYNDTISTAFFILAVLIMILGLKKGETRLILLAFGLLTIGDLFRKIGIVFIIAFILMIVISGKKLNKQTSFYLLIGVAVIIYFLVRPILNFSLIKFGVIPVTYGMYAMPITAWLYMVLNPITFGFQDGKTFNIFYDLGFNPSKATDIYRAGIHQRFIENGIIGNFKILIKKYLWTWTEGSYQMERYGFGYGEPREY